MLYLIGLGLGWKDLSMKALEALSECQEVYLETYTSASDFTPLQLQKLLGKPIHQLDRKQTEEDLVFLEEADVKNVALLVYGDALAATTHQEILQLAKKRDIKVKVIHAPSVFTAVAETGLSLYRFGKVTSIPIPNENYKPESFFDVLLENQKINAHTLFLLDLKPNEGKFLTIGEAIKILLDINQKRNENIFTGETLVVGCARLGTSESTIKAASADELSNVDFGKPPFCLIVPAKLNHKEEEYLSK
jgi:diphthine synthase